MPTRRRTAAGRANGWGGRKAQSIRKQLAVLVESGVHCPFCGQWIQPWQAWDVDHALPIDADPSAMWDTSLLRPAHASCNRRAGQLLSAKKRARVPVPRPAPMQPCAGCSSVLVSPADWLCRDCALVVAGS